MAKAVRVLGALLAATALGVLAPHGVAHGQSRCVPPGEVITPVPWAQSLIAPQRAWPLSTGADQRVAVVGTGIGPSPFLSGVVSDRVDLAPKPSFGEPSGERDCLGLGTAVAGIIAAASQAGVGFHGVAPDVKLLDAKIVGDQYPSGRDPSDTVAPAHLARGIEWATEQDATVIVVPTITYDDSARLRDAVAAAIDAGAVVVASVGEPAQNEPPGMVPYPAAYDGVIGVGALSPDGTAHVSRTGYVDLVAPGVELTTTYPGGGLGIVSGTGFAAAYVAGSVALLRAYRPELGPADVARQLFATAAPAPEGVGSPRYGYGIVSPYHAMVDQLVAGEPAPQPTFEPAVVSDEERARQTAQARSDTFAARLALLGIAVVMLIAIAVGFGSRGRRRRWRPGLAVLPPDLPEDVHPGPPLELLGGLSRSQPGQK